MESLARVNSDKDCSSESSGDLEDNNGMPQSGDLYVGHFGDVITSKNKQTLRIGFQNVGGFPAQRGKLKEDNIKIGLNKWEFDVFGFSETNLDWRLLRVEEKLPLRTQEWWETQHISWTHNRTGPTSTVRQFGGNALFSINQAAHRVIDKGWDKTSLGRWVWTRYQGKNMHTLRIVVAYRPNLPQGPYSVYAQHNAFFNSTARDICPRRAFLQDLVSDLTDFIAAGDNIILMLDGNSNMKQSDLTSALKQLDLEEAILERHGLNGPATQKRNTTSTPIDGIWKTPGIEIEHGGYFGYDEVFPNTDHRCLWIDVSFVSAFGHVLPTPRKRTPKRLHCRDPRLVENYVKLYHQYVAPFNLFERVNQLDDRSQRMYKHEVMQEYEELDLI